MNTTQKDTPDTRAATARPARTPRPRAGQARPAEARGYAKARAAFEHRAQEWMLGRPERVIFMPEDLDRLAAACGIPCRTCGAAIHRRGDAGHQIRWTWVPDRALDRGHLRGLQHPLNGLARAPAGCSETGRSAGGRVQAASA